jgi:cyclophilin family peptidyl-prolyl cis-trans isomerase
MAPNKKRKNSKRKFRKKLFLAIGILVIILIGIGAYILLGQPANQPNTSLVPTPSPSHSASQTPAPTSSDPSYVNPTRVLLQTSVGNITLELRSDKPITTTNFINIVQQRKYDGTVFHRVIAGFMIQGGTISGSTSTIADEIGTNNHNLPYTIARAKTSDPNSATSQFFINVGDNSKTTYSDGSTFDGTYTVFGKVVEGQNIVSAIANAQATDNPYTHEPKSYPLNPVTLLKASIIS